MFDEEIALKVFGILDRNWKEKRGIFRDVVLPQDQWPIAQLDHRTMANWFFYAAIPMRGGVISEAPFKWFWMAQQRYPEMFDPKIVAKKWSLQKITKAMRELGGELFGLKATESWSDEAFGYKMKEHVASWHHNSLVLANHWGGNILNVYDGVKDFEEAFARIDHKKNGAGIKGIRRKIFALLTIWLQEKKTIPLFPTPIPVDFHAMREFFGTNIIRHSLILNPFQGREDKHPEQLNGKMGKRIYESFVDKITVWSQRFILENGFSHLNINPALWVLGRTLCGRNFQNISRKKGTEFVEPSILASNPSLWPKNYKDPCELFCPIKDFCQWSIPASPYYDWGLLVILGKRIPYNLGLTYLPGIDWSEVIDFKVRKKQQ